MRRVAFLFSSEMSQEFRDVAAGTVPSHRVFGAFDVDLPDVDAVWFRWPRRWPRRWRTPRIWRVLQALALVFTRDLEGVVCTTEAPAPPVLVLRALRLLRCRVVVVNVALLKPTNRTGVRRAAMSALFTQADVVVSYARSQVDALCDVFGIAPARSIFVPFGVDTRFFSPVAVAVAVETRDRSTLMVGTNPGKDLQTLMRAIAGLGPCLVVTDEANIADARRVEVPAAVAFARDVPIERLRHLYRTSARVVLPLREGPTSTGQTVLLENMVMGNRVIVSDVACIRDYVDDATAILVPAGDVAALRAQLEGDPAPLDGEHLSRVRRSFSVTRLADTLASLALSPPAISRTDLIPDRRPIARRSDPQS